MQNQAKRSKNANGCRGIAWRRDTPSLLSLFCVITPQIADIVDILREHAHLGLREPSQISIFYRYCAWSRVFGVAQFIASSQILSLFHVITRPFGGSKNGCKAFFIDILRDHAHFESCRFSSGDRWTKPGRQILSLFCVITPWSRPWRRKLRKQRVTSGLAWEADSIAILRDHAHGGYHKIVIHLLLVICD